jgi:Zn-dependent alcohol dehydrogenase
VRTYPLTEINTAVEDVRSGAAVKAVLIHGAGHPPEGE